MDGIVSIVSDGVEADDGDMTQRDSRGVASLCGGGGVR